MQAVTEKNKALLEEVEVILQFLSHPSHLNEPDGEIIRAMLCERALDKVHQIIEQE